MNEKDKLIKGTVIDVLEWLMYQDALLDRYVMGKVKPSEIYNRYLDDKKL